MTSSMVPSDIFFSLPTDASHERQNTSFGLEVDVCDDAESAVVWIVDRLHPDDTIDRIRMIPRNMRGEIHLRPRRPSDKDCLRVGDRFDNSFEKILEHGDIDIACLEAIAVNAAHGMMRENHDVVRGVDIDMENLCIAVVDPHERIIMAGHGMSPHPSDRAAHLVSPPSPA